MVGRLNGDGKAENADLAPAYGARQAHTKSHWPKGRRMEQMF